MLPALARFVRCSMGFTTSYWQKERWSRRAADTLTSYGRCWSPSLGTWDVKWRVGVECQRRKCADRKGIESFSRREAANLPHRVIDLHVDCALPQLHR